MAKEPITQQDYQEANSLRTDALQHAELNYWASWLNCAVLTVGDAAPPGSPTNGDCYIVGTGSGDWTGHDDELAVYRDAWQFYAPKEGASCVNLDDGYRYVFLSGAWATAAVAAGVASAVTYDNTTSGLVAADVQAAIDELALAVNAPSGASIGVQLLADTASTSDADPGAGNLRWNNATQSSATIIYLDDTTVDGASLTAIWPQLNAGGVLFLQHATDQDVWQIWEFTAINDASGYVKLTVTLWAAAGSFADNDPILATLDKGQAAPSGTVTVNTPSNVSGTVTLNFAGLSKYVGSITLGANVTTFAFSNLPGAGLYAEYELHIKQDPATPRTFALPASHKALGGSDTAISASVGVTTVLTGSTIDNGTTWRYAMQESA